MFIKRLLLLASTLVAAPVLAAGIDETINSATAPIAEAIVQFVFFKIPVVGADLPIVVLWLVVGAVFFTFYTGFINFRGFKHAIQLTRGDYSDPNSQGEVSHFQALATAVSGTVGIGNIGGVAVAVTVGGPGATFWLIVAGFLGMSTKFVECTLGVKYRNENPRRFGVGWADVLSAQGFCRARHGRLWQIYGRVLCGGHLCGSLGYWQHVSVQSSICAANHVSGGALDGLGWLVGIVLALVVFMVIVGGIKSIAKVTEKIVPFMAVFYCIFAIIVIILNASAIPQAITNIFYGAFTGEGVAGGALGGNDYRLSAGGVF